MSISSGPPDGRCTVKSHDNRRPGRPARIRVRPADESIAGGVNRILFYTSTVVIVRFIWVSPDAET